MEGDQGGIKVRFKNPKIGKLPIPMKCLNFILKKLTVQNLNIKNEVLYIDSCFTIKIGNKPVTLEIGDFRILNGNFIFKIYGADSAVKSFVNRTLKGVLEI